MTTTTKTIGRPMAALNLPKKVPALLTYAQGIAKGLTGNASLPAPTPTLAAIQTPSGCTSDGGSATSALPSCTLFSASHTTKRSIP